MLPHSSITTCSLFILLSLFLIPSSNAEELILAKKNQARFTIAAPGNNATEQFAAEELAKYLGLMSNSKFKINHETEGDGKSRIIIGTPQSLGKTTALSRLKVESRLSNPDSFFVDIQPSGKVFIIGATPRAVMYGVYDFLEKDLGARWTIPGPQGEYIPVSETLVLHCTERLESPTFELRCFEIMGGEKEAGKIIEIIDWIAKRKMNMCLLGWCYIDWNMYEKELKKEILKRDLVSGCSNHSCLLPAKKYAPQHPEYYALRDGARKWSDSPFECHLCNTNPEVIQAVASELDNFARKYPELTQLGMLPADGYKFCQCPECTKLIDGECGDFWPGQNVPNASGLILNFVNQVDKIFKPAHPTATLWFEAYSPTILPPTHIVPGKDVNMMLFLYWRCALHPLSDPTCRRAKEYAEALKGWRKICKGKIMAADYFCGLTQPIPWWPTMTIIKSDYEFLHENGINGVKIWGLNSKWFKTDELSAYLNAELLWNLHQDTWTPIRHFCEGRYGTATESMMDYYREIARGMEHAATLQHEISSPNTWQLPSLYILDPAKLCNLIEKAKTEAADERSKVGVNDAWIRNEYAILLAGVGKANVLCEKALKDKKDPKKCIEEFENFHKAVTAFAAFFKAHLNSGIYYGRASKLEKMDEAYRKSGEIIEQDKAGAVKEWK